jgi:hypothetical protein
MSPCDRARFPAGPFHFTRRLAACNSTRCAQVTGLASSEAAARSISPFSHADVDPHRAFDPEGNDPVEAWPAQSRVTPETEDHAALILLGDAESREKNRDDDASGE